jgi:hypothetical protein
MSGRCSHAPKACFRSGALSLSLHSRADGTLVDNAGRPGALVSGGGLGFLCWAFLTVMAGMRCAQNCRRVKNHKRKTSCPYGLHHKPKPCNKSILSRQSR